MLVLMMVPWVDWSWSSILRLNVRFFGSRGASMTGLSRSTWASSCEPKMEVASMKTRAMTNFTKPTMMKMIEES